jgi:hypothetical protein
MILIGEIKVLEGISLPVLYTLQILKKTGLRLNPVLRGDVGGGGGHQLSKHKTCS